MKKARWILAGLVGLWMLFAGFGIALHERAKAIDTEGNVSVAGLDGEIYLHKYINIATMFRIRKRHPAEPVILAPAYVIGSSVCEKAGPEPAKIALILLFAALGAATVWMLGRLVRDPGAVAIWLSFAYVWLLAAEPEVFAVSQAILIGVLLMVRRGVRHPSAWLGMAALAGGATLTNGIKPLLAWGVTTFGGTADGTDWRTRCRRLAKPLAGLAALVLIGIAAEVAKWKWIDGMSPADEIAMGWDYIVRWMAGDMPFGERLARTWEMFFCEPIIRHGAVLSRLKLDEMEMLPLGYPTILPHLVCGTLYALAAISAWRNRDDAVVRAALTMVTVDIGLHVVVGWGIAEGQIYCGHWFWILPVLLAKLPGRAWKFAFAAALVALNGYCRS